MAAVLAGPKEVLYCGVCGLPPEYCSFGPDFEKCKPWLIANCPGLYPELADVEGAAEMVKSVTISDASSATAAAEAASAASAKPKGGKKKAKEQVVLISRTQRNKRKFVTTVLGLDLFGVKLADARKAFSNRFSCGASVVKTADGREEIDVQGDFKDEMVDLILANEKWAVPQEAIYFLEAANKRTPARE